MALLGALLTLPGTPAGAAAWQGAGGLSPPMRWSDPGWPPQLANPLTGEGLALATRGRVPLAVVIDNHAAARPQSGLGASDLVVELPVEGGMSRYLALMWSDYPALVGPIRSARDYMLQLGWGLGAVPVHIGGSPSAYRLIKGSGHPVLNAMEMAEGFSWVGFRPAPHRLYGDARVLAELAAAGPAPPQPAPVGWGTLPPATLPGGSLAHTATVTQPGRSPAVTVFDFDPGSGYYSRSTAGRLQVEYGSGEPERWAAAVILYTAIERIPGDAEGRLQVELEAGGRADILTRGRLLVGRWLGGEGFPRLVLEGGAAPRLAPGPVFIMVVDTRTEVRVR